MRVHELAKELDTTSKDLIAEIQALGGSVKNHMSQIDDSQLESAPLLLQLIDCH